MKMPSRIATALLALTSIGRGDSRPPRIPIAIRQARGGTRGPTSSAALVRASTGVRECRRPPGASRNTR